MKICSDCKGSSTNGIERGHGPCDSCSGMGEVPSMLALRSYTMGGRHLIVEKWDSFMFPEVYYVFDGTPETTIELGALIEVKKGWKFRALGNTEDVHAKSYAQAVAMLFTGTCRICIKYLANLNKDMICPDCGG